MVSGLVRHFDFSIFGLVTVVDCCYHLVGLVDKFGEAFVKCVVAFLVIEVYQYLLHFSLHVC